VPESSAALLRAAGYAAFLIIPLLTASGIALWLFFDGAGAIFGSINDLLVAICLGLMVLPVLALRSIVGTQAGPWFDVVSGLALAGLALAAAGQVLLVAGGIALETSFVTGGVGILPVLAWAIAIAILAMHVGALPNQLGWATVALLAMIVVASLGSAVLPPAGIVVLSVALLTILVGWLAIIGSTCLAGVASGPIPASP
jgi:hypothetical protein